MSLGVPGGVEPLDWLDTSCPQRWRTGLESVAYHWFDRAGAGPFDMTD